MCMDLCLQIAPVLSGVFSTLNEWGDLISLLILLRSCVTFVYIQLRRLAVLCLTTFLDLLSFFEFIFQMLRRPVLQMIVNCVDLLSVFKI